MFERELAFFIDHQDELVRQFGGQVLLLHGDQVVGAYSSAIEAYEVGSARFGVGSFMLQPCEAGADAYTVTLVSSEVFG